MVPTRRRLVAAAFAVALASAAAADEPPPPTADPSRPARAASQEPAAEPPPPAPAAAAQDPAAAADPAALPLPAHGPSPDAALVHAMRKAPLSDLPRPVREDPRLRALDEIGRMQLLDALKPGVPFRLSGIVLNAFPGFGVGSLVQGDPAGAGRQALGELAGAAVFVAGAMVAFASDEGGEAGAAVALCGLVGFGVVRVNGIRRAAMHEGWRARALRHAWESAPDPMARPAPPDGARGLRLALEF
jgi:hypothetical protein